MSIPKIIHMIWIGTDPFPYQENLDSYKEKHPGWKINLWTDKNIPKLRNKKIYDALPMNVTKADLLRLEILYKYGGIYVDADSYCIKPIDNLILGKKCFFSTNFRGYIEINFMGCEANNPTIDYLLKKLSKFWERTTAKKTEFTVYCIYRYIKRKLKKLPYDWIGREYNCSVEEQTKNTHIIQMMDHTWGENKMFTLENKEAHYMYDVIYLAAGQGKRAKLGYPKQFARLGGKPIMIHALEIFQNMNEIGNIIIPCAEQEKTKEHIDSYGIQKTMLIPGGHTRQASVYAALKYVNTKYVLIHEAVRPFITEEFVRRIIDTDGNAVTPRRQSRATIIDNNGKCHDRNFFGEVQMPQKYSTFVLQAGHETACEAKRYDFTDDAAIVDYMNILKNSISVIEGLEKNIKITTPLDLVIAEAIYNEGNSNGE